MSIIIMFQWLLCVKDYWHFDVNIIVNKNAWILYKSTTDFVCIQSQLCQKFHLREISSQIIECTIFAPYDSFEMNSF